MLKGINQWCFGRNTPLEKVFEVGHKAGFDSVELAVFGPGGTGLTMDTTPAEAREISALSRRHGLRISSLVSGLLGDTPLSSADLSQREKGRNVVIKLIELAGALEIDTILVVPGYVNSNIGYDECYERSRDELNKLLPTAEKHNVVMAVENVWNNFLLSPFEMAHYLDDFRSPYIASYFDVGNVLKFGFPEQWIRILGSRIRKIHVKDYRVLVGSGKGFVPLLSGDVNWRAVYNALQEIGYKSELTAELSPYDANPMQLIYDTSRHLDVIMGKEPK